MSEAAFQAGSIDMKEQETTVTGVNGRLSSLSAERRALLALKLKARGIDETDRQKVRLDRGAPQQKNPQQFVSFPGGQGAPGLDFKHASHSADAPLSFAQQRFWFLDQLYPDSSAYNIPEAVRLSGSLNVQAMRRSLYEVAMRHEVLRTTFGAEDGSLKQIIAKAPKINLPVIDLAALSEPVREAESSALMGEEANQSFNLSTGPLMRTALVRLAVDDHLLLLTMHHIISDGWSAAIFIREAAALYGAFVSGGPSPLKEPQFQYADFARWQRQWLRGETLESQLDYWKRQLQDGRFVLELPVDRPRPAVQTFSGARQTAVLPKALTEQIKALSRQEGVTVFMTLLAAFQTLLYRYTNEDKILVGSPIAGRNRSEFEDLIGLFVNTLILRADFSERLTFRGLLRQVRNTALGAYAHQELPFEKLVEELQPGRDLSRSPLFQVMFIFQNTPLEPLDLTGLAQRQVRVENHWATFDLNLSMIEKPEGFAASLEYNTDLFYPASMQRLLGHFQALLEAVVADPARRVVDLPILTECESNSLRQWNATTKDFPEELSVHSMFEAQAERTPEACAVICGEERLTYAELNSRANQLARYLCRFGIGPEAQVSVCFERSLEMIVGMLGILKAGAAYLPLDPAYPKERLTFMIEDAKATIVVTRERFLDVLAQTGARCVCLDKDQGELERESTLNLGERVLPDNVAYSIYTSGSTGNPKGVMISHKSVINLVSGLYPLLGFDESDVWTVFHSYAFDFSVWELWAPLLNGARVVLVPASIAQSPAEFHNLLASEQVTVLHQTPSAFRPLLKLMNAEEHHGLRLSLKQIILGGDALPRDLIGNLPEGNFKFWNLYGPTEATVWSAFHGVSRTEGPISIGSPLPNTQLYILDEHSNPLPVMIPGELFIGGSGLARGYLNRPDLTAERFIPYAHSEIPGQRLYRTGDRARFLPDGKLECLGRIDQQLKIRGYRVEPGDIEAAIERHHSVKSAVVVARENRDQENCLVAYVVPQNTNSVSVSQLRKFIQDKLPEYMIPSSFVMLNSLPVTRNGKLDRHNLPAPERERPDLDSAFAGPRTAIEELLSRLWAEVLGLARVGIDDSFFELGGDSIAGVRLIAKATQAGLRFTPRQLFQSPTIAELAGAVELHAVDSNEQGSATGAPPTARGIMSLQPDRLDREKVALLSERGGEVEAVYQLSPMQQGMLFHTLVSPESMEYLEQLSCSVNGPLDVSAFEEAWLQVINRNPALRTCFDWERFDEPVQIVFKSIPAPLERHDLSGLPAHEQLSRIQSYITTEQRGRGFDPSSAPLMRLALFHLGANSHRFVWSFHHLMIDGWSIPLVLNEVYELYSAYSQGQKPEAESRPPYGEYISWLSARDLRQAELAWRRELKGFVAPTQIGAGRSSTGRSPDSAGYRELKARLTATRTEALQTVARRHRITFSTLLQGAWALLLSRYSTGRDVVFGSVVSGRPAEVRGVELMVGVFINTLPVRARVSQGTAALTFLREFQSRQTEMRQFEFSPLVKVQRWSEVPPGVPLFESIFVYEHYPLISSLQTLGKGTWTFDYLSEQHTGYPIHFMAVPGDELLLRLTYLKDRFDAAAIARMLAHYEHILEEIVADPMQPLESIAMLSEAECKQLLVEWNDTAAENPLNQSFVSAFEARAAQTPGAVAAIAGADYLTYDSLNKQSNRLARFLVSQGVGPDVVVALFAARGLNLLTAILAVFKAGGAYLPLDPHQPAARHGLVLSTSGCGIILATDEFRDSVEKALAGMGPEARPAVFVIEPILAQEQSTLNLPVRCAPQNLAYLIYTSGSTGAPKGAMLEQAGMLNHLTAKVIDLQLSESDIVAQTAPQSFDISVWQFLAALMVGGQVHIFDDAVTGDPLRLIEEADRNRISILEVVPSVLRAILEEMSRREPHRHELSSLRWLILTGEALPPEASRRWFDLHPGTPLMNAYGPTECSDDVTHWRTAVPPTEGVTRLPIGRPVVNTQVYIVDSDQRPVPVAVRGELYVAGIGVGRGYASRPDLTAERFVPNPFSDEPGTRMYRTGDLARYLPDGNIEFLGRTDNQLKIRGFRIELEEVESVLLAHNLVEAAAVVARNDRTGDQRLVAYFVGHEGSAITATELQRYLAERLPEYMVPSVLVKLDRMPLTSAGKVDRKLLPEVVSTDETLNENLEPRTEVEEIVSGILADVLGLGRIGLNDNFFRMGGHSLMATQVVSRVRDVMKIELPLRSLFEEPTAAALSKRIEAEMKSGRGPAVQPIRIVSRDEEIKLSFGQERLWLLDQLEPNSSAYNMPLAVRLRGRLDVDALRRSLDEIVRRHESLRTRFDQIDGRPVQIIEDAKSSSLQLTDLSALDDVERESEAVRLAAEESLRPFDLSRCPLMRSRLARLSESEHVFFMTMHHIVSDGWSMRIFVQELTALYTAYRAGEPHPLADLPIQYADYAAWQRKQLEGEGLETQLGYWKKQLGGELAVLELPFGGIRPAVKTFRSGTRSMQLPAQVIKPLRELCQQESVTMFMTLLAAFKVLLHRYTGQEDILVGTPIAGRGRPQAEKLIGFFLNTLVIRTDLSGNPSFRDMLRRVREVALGAYANQDVPFEKLLQELQPERDLSRTPLFHVFFNMLNIPGEKAEMGELNLEIDSLAGTEIGSKFDITLYASEQNEGLRLNLVYNANLFDEDSMIEMLEQYRLLLMQVAGNAGESIGSYTLVTDRAKESLPDATHLFERKWETPVHKLFREQAEERPTAIAISENNATWSYGRLDRFSDQIANRLIDKGMRTGQVVAIYAGRSSGLVAAILAVMKAGGVFTIIDSSLPALRIVENVKRVNPVAFINARQTIELPEEIQLYLENEGIRTVEHGIDESGEEPDARPEEVGTDRSAADSAYITFTSGSTGTPKAVVGSYGPLSHFIAWHTLTFHLHQTDRYSMLSGLSHDPLLRDIFTPLCSGATLCIPGDDDVISSAGLVRWMRRERISVAHLTPAMAQVLTETGTKMTDIPGDGLASLRYVFFGADLLTFGDVYRLNELARAATCVNFYGATETPQAMSYCVVSDKRASGDEGSYRRAQVVPLGGGIDGVQLLVLNAAGALAGVGERGEIYVRTPYLAKGYLDDDNLTTERFIVNPFTNLTGDRLYKTGDLGRYLTDGSVQPLGRADGQIKVRGYRVELAEVEAVLRDHHSVRETALVAIDAASGGKKIIAYVVPGETPAGVSELHEFLKKRLPDYMIPSAFVTLERIPLTPNGKVDRRELPVPEGMRPELETGFEAPRTPDETALAQIWSEVLGIQVTGVHDNFFHLGGHSLLAMQVMSRVQSRFELELSLRRLFENPTVAELALVVADARFAKQRAEEEELLEALAEFSAQELATTIDQMRRDQLL